MDSGYATLCHPAMEDISYALDHQEQNLYIYIYLELYCPLPSFSSMGLNNIAIMYGLSTTPDCITSSYICHKAQFLCMLLFQHKVIARCEICGSIAYRVVKLQTFKVKELDMYMEAWFCQIWLPTSACTKTCTFMPTTCSSLGTKVTFKYSF